MARNFVHRQPYTTHREPIILFSHFVYFSNPILGVGIWEILKLGNLEIRNLGIWEIGKLGYWDIGKLGIWEVGKFRSLFISLDQEIWLTNSNLFIGTLYLQFILLFLTQYIYLLETFKGFKTHSKALILICF